MLKITKAEDMIRVDHITTTLYGAPGVGKTSLAFTAERPLLLDFDGGAQRALNRKDSVRVDAWGDITAMNAEDMEDYKTIIVDTVGRALDSLATDLMRADAKLRNRSGGLTLQGYGALKAGFTSWMKHLHSMGKDVLLIAHMDEQRSGDEIMERLDIQGGSKNEVHKLTDAMGRVSIINNTRYLNFNPTDAAYGKNPGQLEPLKVPNRVETMDGFMAVVIQQIKDSINASSEAALVEEARVNDLRESFGQFDTPEAFTESAAKMVKDGAKPKDKALLNAVAVSKGYIYDKEAGSYKVNDAPTENPTDPQQQEAA